VPVYLPEASFIYVSHFWDAFLVSAGVTLAGTALLLACSLLIRWLRAHKPH
jgi:hypothetical protein